MAANPPSLLNATCPVNVSDHERIVLGHGSGGKLTAALIADTFLPAFANPILERMDDQAVVEFGPERLAFTTDSFVVTPIFFPGGDIGSLAVHGTVNDLAMAGARPLYLAAAFILEEGLAREDLRRVVASMGQAARDCGVQVVTGDTKVVNRGQADRIFITTTGVGLVPAGVTVSANRARPGDHILLSGTMGDHGMAILSQREGLEFEAAIASDTAPLYPLVAEMLAAAGREPGGTDAIRCLRDPTRGGLATSLHEIAASSGVAMRVRQQAIPVRETVASACELLGIDPLYVANEGKLVAVVAPEASERVLAAMCAHPLGRGACRIGEVAAAARAQVLLETEIGGTRLLDTLFHEQLPRIC